MACQVLPPFSVTRTTSWCGTLPHSAFEIIGIVYTHSIKHYLPASRRPVMQLFLNISNVCKYCYLVHYLQFCFQRISVHVFHILKHFLWYYFSLYHHFTFVCKQVNIILSQKTAQVKSLGMMRPYIAIPTSVCQLQKINAVVHLSQKQNSCSPTSLLHPYSPFTMPMTSEEISPLM